MITKAELREELIYTQERLAAFREFLSDQRFILTNCDLSGFNIDGTPVFELKPDPDGNVRVYKMTLIGAPVEVEIS